MKPALLKPKRAAHGKSPTRKTRVWGTRLPHSSSAVSDLYAQLRDAITAGNVAADRSANPLPVKPPDKK
ncbi:MAG TPA: hypothetical protein VEI73_13400 [Candidatus Acidoferrum sp.]|nr:hypothetical protein [Candidatus Acidoferrum sp.]